MEITTVAVLGGSGFIGRHVCHALAAHGYRVRVATRDRERAKEQLILLPTAEVAVVDIHEPAQLAEFVSGADAVMNLVGVLHDGRGERGFQTAHAGLARKVVAACRERGVRREQREVQTEKGDLHPPKSTGRFSGRRKKAARW